MLVIQEVFKIVIFDVMWKQEFALADQTLLVDPVTNVDRDFLVFPTVNYADVTSAVQRRKFVTRILPDVIVKKMLMERIVIAAKLIHITWKKAIQMVAQNVFALATLIDVPDLQWSLFPFN